MRKKIVQFKTGDLPLCRFYEPYNSVLRTPTTVTKLSFNKGIFSFLDRMKHTATSYKLLYLTAPQVFSKENMFIINKNFKDHVWMHQSYKNANQYKGYINPEIVEMLGDKVDVWQKCASIPYVEAKIQRFQQLKVTYSDQKREVINEQFFGFKSYVFQHCIDHLKGRCVLDWNLCKGNVRVYKQVQHIFPKTKFVLKDYTMRIKQALQKRPKQTTQLTLTEEQKKLQKNHEEVLRKVLNQEITSFTEKFGSHLK